MSEHLRTAFMFNSDNCVHVQLGHRCSAQPCLAKTSPKPASRRAVQLPGAGAGTGAGAGAGAGAEAGSWRRLARCRVSRCWRRSSFRRRLAIRRRSSAVTPPPPPPPPPRLSRCRPSLHSITAG